MLADYRIGKGSLLYLFEIRIRFCDGSWVLLVIFLGVVVFWLHCDFIPFGSTARLYRLTELYTLNAFYLFHAALLLLFVFSAWERFRRENLSIILWWSMVLIVDVRVTRWRQWKRGFMEVSFTLLNAQALFLLYLHHVGAFCLIKWARIIKSPLLFVSSHLTIIAGL